MDSSNVAMINFEEYKSVKDELENTKQELHEYKRKLKITESTQQDYRNEIDMLQSEEIKQKQKYQAIIKQLEHTIDDNRCSHIDEKQVLEDIVTGMQEKIERLQTELHVYKQCNSNNTTHSPGETTTLIQEFLSETPEYCENQESELILKDLTAKNEMLHKKAQENDEELENLKQSYKCQKIELLEALENNTFLSDENMCFKAELDFLKSQPLSKDSKGNSLFAEVDDRRVYLQDKISEMQSSYLSMTQERNQLQNIVHQLKLENLRLLEKWKCDISEVYDDEHEIKVALRSRIKVLENLNESYVKELSEKPWIISNVTREEMKFFEKMLTTKRDEIKSWKDQYFKKSLTLNLTIIELMKVKEERRKWRLEAMTKQHELELLKLENPCYKDQKDNSDRKEEDNARSSLKMTENSEVSRKDTTKERSYNRFKPGENEGDIIDDDDAQDVSSVVQSRKVTFATDTISPERRNYNIVYKPPMQL